MDIQAASHLLEKAFIHQKDLSFTKSDIAKIREAKNVIFEYYKDNVEEWLKLIVITDIDTGNSFKFGDNLRATQRKALHDFFNAVTDGMVIPKSRQEGITTLFNALDLHHAIHTPNCWVSIIGDKSSTSEKNLARIKDMFHALPEWYKFLFYDYDEKLGHKNNSSSWIWDNKLTGTKSIVDAQSGRERGDPITQLHWTETAVTEDAYEIFQAVFPAIQKSKVRKASFESTGKGAGNLFADMVQGKIKGIHVCFLAWWENPENRVTDDELTLTEEDILPEYLSLYNQGKISLNQIQWHMDKIDGAETAIKGKQEYPTYITDVIRNTGSSFFKFECYNEILPKQPCAYMEFTNGLPMFTNSGPGKVYNHVEHMSNYNIAVDPTLGSVDPCSIGVYNPKNELVFLYNEKIRPDEQATLIYHIAKHYNNAHVLIERNGVGGYVIDELYNKWGYVNLYTYIDGKIGLQMGPDLKAHIASMLQKNIIDGIQTEYGEAIVKEMEEWDGARLTHPRNGHDDNIMRAAMNAWLFDQRPPKERMNERNYYELYGETVHLTPPVRRFRVSK